MTMVSGGSTTYFAIQNYGGITPLNPSHNGSAPSALIPSSGGNGGLQMLPGPNDTFPTYWVLRNGTVWQSTGTGIAQIIFPETVAGLFNTVFDAPTYAMGASGKYYAVTAPTTVAGSLPEPIAFCGFVVEWATGDQSNGAWYASGKRGVVYRLSQGKYNGATGAYDNTGWVQVVLAKISQGSPNTPLALDNMAVIYSGVPV